MKKVLHAAFLLFISSLNSTYCQTNISTSIDNKDFDPSTLLWYQTPASAWEDALPVGNGRLGAMVFGKYGEERIQLNEDTYWSGGPYSTVVEGGYKELPAIQKSIFDGHPIEAHKLFGRYLMGYPVEQQKYQALANLILTFENENQVTDYKRWLDLKTGITSVEYKAHGVTYSREIFSSAPDQTIAIRITADKPKSISFKAELRGERNSAHSNYATDYFRMDGAGNDGLALTGKSADYLGVEGKLRYEARLKAVAKGGTTKVNDVDLIIKDADEVTLYFVAATNFINYKDVSGDCHAKVENYLSAIDSKSYDNIREAAVRDYNALFNRVTLTLPATKRSFLPTDQRLKDSSEQDPQLASLCYQFGRYILISSSRPGTQPANLQGIWNNNMNPPWDSKYTTNINTQMNYWPVESANLSELSEPLVKMVKELTDQGSQVAKEHYGAKEGWVCHQNTDIWRVAAPMDGPTWGTFTVGGAWLTNELWEHYLFTLDKQYLKDIYPVVKGSVEFFMDFLVEYPNNDKRWLITCPSNSPENPPKAPGYRYFFDEVTSMWYFTTICAGSSIDMQILTDLFGYYIEASKTLGVDKDFAMRVANARARLVPPQIGRDGMLQEWAEDYEQLEPKHRHNSHLYGLYPGNVFSPKKTPSFIEPIKKVLEERGDEGAGFSRAWKMSLWARLYDGNRALKIFKGYLKQQCFSQLFAKCFTPMQVDGSLGVTAAITEMLIQSHEGVIDLLPALPDEWSEGKFSGVCARGAFELSFQWAKNKITQAVILSKEGGSCRMNAKVPVVISSSGKRVKVKNLADGIIEFATKKGDRYDVKAK